MQIFYYQIKNSAKTVYWRICSTNKLIDKITINILPNQNTAKPIHL